VCDLPNTGKCTISSLEITRTDLSPTDGCEAQLSCPDEVAIVVGCDGENDGTNTSLCSCTTSDGRGVNLADLYDGEAPDACLSAAADCVDAL
jgi:hypothetical protein